MSRRKEIAMVTAGILAGIAVSGPAAQAASGILANPSNQKFYVEDQRISIGNRRAPGVWKLYPPALLAKVAFGSIFADTRSESQPRESGK